MVAEGAAPTFTVYAGEGPTPAGRGFLGLPGHPIAVAKDVGPVVPAIEEMIVGPAGANLNLVNGTPRPHEFPSVARDLTFSCDPTDVAGGGNCGPATNHHFGFMLEGRTTDGSLGGLGRIGMPDPVNQYATFRCLGLYDTPTITMAEEFVEAVLGTNATRIETRLLRVSTETDEQATSIAVGHGMVGYTDIQ